MSGDPAVSRPAGSGGPPAAILTAFRNYLGSRPGPLVEDFTASIDWDMRERALPPREIACVRHLDRLCEIAQPRERALVRLLADERHALHWGQTYTSADFGEHFLDNYGWVELFGARGHFANDVVAAGFLILGPGVAYPDHHHVAEELYVPLTGGAAWRQGEGAFADRAAGETIHHRSNVSHAMRTGTDPLLALYLWRNGPLTQKSTVTGRADGHAGSATFGQ